MPFTVQEERLRTVEKPSEALLVPGNRAWTVYREMKRIWNLTPRWTTADAIHFAFVQHPEDNTYLDDVYRKCPTMGWNELCNASHLAWQVFFSLVVLPYEIQKREENGDVE